MSAAVATRPAVTVGTATLRRLAWTEARRYARHPLFLVGVVVSFGLIWLQATARSPDPLEATVTPAFFIGVFGLVVAQRLTTSLGRTGELVDSLPSPARRRTLALCLACLVPFAAAVLCTVEIVVAYALYRPVPVPVDAPMVWWGHGITSTTLLSILLATGAVAGLGGPLLGVMIGTWAPFRGVALLTVVALVVGTATPASGSGVNAIWRAVPPWSALTEEHVVHGKIVSSTLVPHLSAVWYLVYVLLLCLLGVVGALLHEREGRRPLLWTGAALLLASAGALAMTIA